MALATGRFNSTSRFFALSPFAWTDFGAHLLPQSSCSRCRATACAPTRTAALAAASSASAVLSMIPRMQNKESGRRSSAPALRYRPPNTFCCTCWRTSSTSLFILLAPSCLSTRLQGRTRRHLSFCRRNTLTKHCSAVCSAGSNPSRCQSSCACLRAPFHGLCSRNFPALPITQHSPLPPPLPKATHIYSTLVLSSSSPFSHCTANVSSSHLVVR
jgi:hypothetical protein